MDRVVSPAVGRTLDGPERHQPEPDAYLQEPLHLSNDQDPVAYVSPPIPGLLTAIGPVALNFYAAIDQPDTNWMVDLYDATPAGQETGPGGGYLKASHRAVDEDRSEPGRPAHLHTEEACNPIERGDVYEYNVVLNPITMQFNPGHRLKLEIHSMESPRVPEMHIHYHPKLTIARTTLHKVFRNDKYRSHLRLPVVSMDDTVRDVMRDDKLPRDAWLMLSR